MASTRKRSRTKRQQEESFVSGFQTEIVLLVILAACIILMVSALGMGGIVGDAIRKFLFGTMGILAYVFPILLFLGFGFILSNRTNLVAYKKLFAAIVFFVFLCALLQLSMEGFTRSTMLSEYYELCSDYSTGGGVIGGAICMIVTSSLGVLCSYVIYILIMIICFILVTQRSFFGYFQKIGKRLGNAAQSSHERYKEGQPEREEKRAIIREKREIQRKRKKAEKMRRLKEELEEEKMISENDLFDEEKAAAVSDSEKLSGKKAKKKKKSENIDFRKPSFLEGTKLAPREEDDASGEQINTLLNENGKSVDLIDESDDAALLTINTKESSQGQLEFKIQRSEPSSYEEEMESEDINQNFYNENDLSDGIEAADEASSNKVDAEGVSKRSSAKNPKSSPEEIANGIQNVQEEIENKEVPEKPHVFPPMRLMKRGDRKAMGDSDEYLRNTAQKLQETLRTFNVNVTVTNVSCGPTVTRFELQPEMGVKVSRILSLADDIKLNLATPDIRIEAPIPGKAAVGIEVPNKTNSEVVLRDLLESDEFKNASSKLSFAVGKDIAGKVVVADIAKMPHLLIAGATGSGKSVCINTLIISILYKATPKEVKMIMIDPKVVELNVYNGIPHLLIPVVTDPKKAAGALNWAVAEMTNRYNTFAEYSVRNLAEYNKKIETLAFEDGEKKPEKLPQIVIIVDELADLMMVAPGEVEDAICRLAQLARAAGIHLIIATQRPSVNVITGLIKANMPSRIAFSVSQGVDSRTILDMNGAEKLLGKGDMLFYPQGYQKPARLQGAFIPDEEVSAISQFLKTKNSIVGHTSNEIEQQINTVSMGAASAGGSEENDIYFVQAGKFIIEKDKASIGMLQRMFKIGFNRAARIMDQLCDAGVVGPEEGTKPRKVLMSMEQFEAYIEEHNV